MRVLFWALFYTRPIFNSLVDVASPSDCLATSLETIFRGVKPILKVLIDFDFYFGGILLGTGGLVRAYTDAAKLGVEDAEVIEVIEKIKLSIEIEYEILGKIENPPTGNKLSIYIFIIIIIAIIIKIIMVNKKRIFKIKTKIKIKYCK